MNTETANRERSSAIPLTSAANPGTYVCHESGMLLRIPHAQDDGHEFARQLRFGPRHWTVTQLSADPRVGVSEARVIARQLGLRLRL